MVDSEHRFPFTIIESLSNTGTKTVYGDPITVGSRTVVPVARAAYGFGGGVDDESSGGGGGALVTPVGTLELTETTTRFVPLRRYRRPLAAGVAGLLTGYLLGRRR